MLLGGPPIGFAPLGTLGLGGTLGVSTATYPVTLAETSTLVDSFRGGVLFQPVSFSEQITLNDSWISGKFPAVDASKRQILLAPYLKSNPIFTDYVFGIDNIWKSQIDDPIANLAKLRQLYPISKDAEDIIAINDILRFTDFDKFELSTLIRQVNLLGFSLKDSAALVDSDSYKRLLRHVGAFWYEKGKASFIDFIGFCLNASLTITSLWSYNYKNFASEASAKDVDLDHTTGGYASYPSNANQIPSSKLDLSWLGTLTSYTSGNQALIDKWGAAGNRSAKLRVNNTGNPELLWSTDGTAITTAACSAVVPVAGGTLTAIRAKLTLNENGAYTVRFFTGSDMRLWTQLGTTVTGGAPTTVAGGGVPAIVAIGAANAGAEDPAVGKTKRAQFRVDDNLRADFEGIFGGAGGGTTVDRLGNTWTIVAPATLATQSTLTPIYAGGSWFPTTHVDVSFQLPAASTATPDILMKFFNEFSNYNLVLRNIVQVSTITGKAIVTGVGARLLSGVASATGQAIVSGINRPIAPIGVGALGFLPLGF
jgi:hypothetical protein